MGVPPETNSSSESHRRPSITVPLVAPQSIKIPLGWERERGRRERRERMKKMKKEDIVGGEEELACET